jgi:hypothetical protein
MHGSSNGRIEVYSQLEGELQLIHTLLENESLTSPLLPGFILQLADLFQDIPRDTNPEIEN